MRRFLLTTLLSTSLLLAATPAQARWFATKTAAKNVAPLGQAIAVKNQVYITFRKAGPPTPEVIAEGYILNYASVKAFVRAAPTLPRGTRVIYDLEGWDFTPRWQRRHPTASFRKFVQTAHHYHLVAGICPGWIILPGGHDYEASAMNVGEDFFVLQPHPRLDLGQVFRMIHAPVYFKLSAITAIPLPALLAQYRLARHYTKNFVVWGGRAHDIGGPEEAAAIIRRLRG